MIRPAHFLLLASCLFAASCATKKDGAAAEKLPMQQRFRKDQPAIKKDANGNWNGGVGGAQVPEASRTSAYFTGDANLPKRYKAGEFRKTTWWGGKELANQSYSGSTDGSRFQTAAPGVDHSATEANATAPTGVFKTGAYATANAREAAARQVDKPSDSETGLRRRVFPQPGIEDYRELRKMDIKTTRSILGRE